MPSMLGKEPRSIFRACLAALVLVSCVQSPLPEPYEARSASDSDDIRAAVLRHVREEAARIDTAR
jgi:hypothetical protein